MKLYISSAVKFALDTNKLKQAANQSRTSHLFSLMNEQERQYDEDYKESHNRYVGRIRKEKLDKVVHELNAYMQELSLMLQTDLNNVISDIYGEDLPSFATLHSSYDEDDYSFKFHERDFDIQDDTFGHRDKIHLTVVEHRYRDECMYVEIVQDSSTSKLLVTMGTGEMIMHAFSWLMSNHPEDYQEDAYTFIDIAFEQVSKIIEEMLDYFFHNNIPGLE